MAYFWHTSLFWADLEDVMGETRDAIGSTFRACRAHPLLQKTYIGHYYDQKQYNYI